MIITIIILSLLLMISVYVNYNILRKLEKQEDILKGYLEYLDSISRIIELSNKRFEDSRLKKAFESDDEVGFFFKQLKSIQDVLDQFILKKIK